MNISSLREFIVSVSTCNEAEALAGIWHLFQQTGTEQIVVLDDRRAPVGILKLGQFVASVPITEIYGSLDQSQDQGKLSQKSLRAYPNLLEAVRVIRADEALTQLQNQLADLVQQPIVIVNTANEYIGVLNVVQVLHYLAIQADQISHQQSPSPRSSKRSSLHIAGHQAFLEPLIDLLERLPLPLMLQTSSGRMITQNLAWRQRVGAIQQPQRIRRAAARILEAALACKTDAKPQPSMELRSRSKSVANSPASDRTEFGFASLQPTAPQTGICQLGTEPNTCVCLCPMKNGQDRVWQFIKIPMGLPISSQLAPGQGDTTDSINAFGQPALLPFKLASLKFNPDTDWRSLIHTETLWLILAQDMTEQQQVAKELAAKNADLIQLNRLKDEFLACISHELKTPLTAVLGMSSLLKDQLLGDLNDRQSHYAQLIYRSGRHLVAIVNNILDLTRIETGQLELLLEQVHIPTLCQQAYEQAQQQQLIESTSDSPAYNHPDLQFRLEIQPDLQYIVADELRLRQMLTNLLSNAIKFTEGSSEIGLQVESWEGWIAFTVWDTGIGIPEEKQHLIFQKFQQLEQPLTRQFQGTGLGLVLTQRLARLHGGDITFTSVSEQGSQFTLLLPPVPPQASVLDFELPLLKPEPHNPIEGSNRLVLIVETDADRLEERVDQLMELGFRAVIARSGTEAIEKARRLQPTVILLNPFLPLLSGWDVLTLLKTDQGTRNIPVVVTAVRVERDQAYQNGADSFLSLPIEIDVLQRCLLRLIHSVGTEPSVPETGLTVLHLYEGSPSFTLVSNQHHCRVLEVDDLEQADLLARVWKPDVVLIDQYPSEPDSFMQQVSQTKSLSELPLITLSTELTQAANQIPGLSVYPYLAMLAAHQNLGESNPEESSPGESNSGESNPGESIKLQPNIPELMEILQLAAGMTWVPHILIVDCAAIELHAPLLSTRIRPPVRALVQYLQTAGFQSAVSSHWEKVYQKLQHQSIDLLLLCISATEPSSALTQIIETLQQLPNRPPILVWNYQSPIEALDSSSHPEPEMQWNGIATKVLPTSTSILDLLAQINQTLSERRRQNMGEKYRGSH